MPVCGGCTNCNCYVSEDGIDSSAEVLGRNTSVVTGSGTELDPFVISFLDQLEYRPKTAEISLSNGNVASSTGGNGNWEELNIITSAFEPSSKIYESPVVFILRDPSPFTSHSLNVLQANHYIIGATVTFAQVADANTTVRQLILTTFRDNFGVPQQIVIAGQSSVGGIADPQTLSVEAYVPGLFFSVSSVAQPINQFFLYVQQNTGSPLAISDIRIWVTEI